MTVVELLVAVTILSAISYVLTESIVQALVTADTTARRIGESVDAEGLAATFGPDVQSADQVWSPATGFDDACAVVPAPILRLGWADGPVTRIVTYTLGAPSGGERHLTRRACEADGQSDDPSLQLVREHVVARFVAADGTPVVVTCDPGPPCPDAPRSVAMALTTTSGSTFEVSSLRRAP